MIALAGYNEKRQKQIENQACRQQLNIQAIFLIKKRFIFQQSKIVKSSAVEYVCIFVR